ncbi:MAG: lytic transglycosylase domain-containing protein [Sterolibacterium sp.]|nr:lytic transglycosylase domain-containing protein [Sterolibacterium sp.]
MLPGLEQLLLHCAPNVAPTTMMAIIKVESGGRPWALNVNGKQRLARQPASASEAVSWAEWLIAKGYSVDLGLAQVNSRHLQRFALTPQQLLDPCINIAAGAQILSENYAGASRKYGSGQQALRAAISAYNTGNHTRGLTNGYVRKVSAAAHLPTSSPALINRRSSQ